MAVPKVAVIALVAIIAVPILLGYAMNLQEVTVTDYRSAGDSVNITPLLFNASADSYTFSNIYEINTKFNKAAFPIYNVSTTKTSMPLTQETHTGSWYPAGNIYPADYTTFYLVADYDKDVGKLQIEGFDSGGTSIGSVNNVMAVKFDYSTNYAQIWKYGPGGLWGYVTYDTLMMMNGGYFTFSTTGSYSADTTLEYADQNTNTYADLSKGYYLNDHYTGDDVYSYEELNLPNQPKNVLITMDLSTITDSNYRFGIHISAGLIFRMVKTTDAEGVHWALYKDSYLDGLGAKVFDLYYDSSRSSNTYQILMDQLECQFRYVGNWPTIIGYANVYKDFSFKYADWGDPNPQDLSQVGFGYNKTPLMRIDSSEYVAYTYSVIKDQTYIPADFKDNPATIISDVTGYGTSLSFGGNTYTVSKGNISIGTHQIPVKGITLDSVPNSSGTGYDNRINGTVISTTADPSQIVFNGQWSASISTTAQAATTYTKTEWIAGSFAWDGMDQNFLMAGLITSLGVFIALGIYGRRSGARVLPLMLVCGGAALLFFIMI